MTRLPPLVDVDWLAERLDRPDLRVVDASWHLPGSGRDAVGEYAEGHIPGAVFFDLDRIADTDNPLPHMLPEPERFAEAVGRLGIGNDTDVVVYDQTGLFSAARAWWMFHVFGHERVAILDGGLAAWRARGLALEADIVEPAPARFDPRYEADRVRTLEAMRRNLETGAEAVVDARPAGRFAGTDPEPRPGLPSGHIPGARNVPSASVSDPATGRMRSPQALADLFGEIGEEPVVCSCGTGVTACVLAFALERIGRGDVAVYDGSWTEWASQADAPIERGPEKSG